MANEILENVLVALGVDIEFYKNEEDLCRDQYLMNYEEVAHAVIDYEKRYLYFK